MRCVRHADVLRRGTCSFSRVSCSEPGPFALFRRRHKQDQSSRLQLVLTRGRRLKLPELQVFTPRLPASWCPSRHQGFRPQLTVSLCSNRRHVVDFRVFLCLVRVPNPNVHASSQKLQTRLRRYLKSYVSQASLPVRHSLEAVKLLLALAQGCLQM